jgi:hypothetical protein
MLRGTIPMVESMRPVLERLKTEWATEGGVLDVDIRLLKF